MPRSRNRASFAGGDIVGVGFEGDFGVGGKNEMPPQVFHQFGKLGAAEPGRGAAA